MTVFNIKFSPFPFRSEHFPFYTSKCVLKWLKTVSSFQRQAKVKKKNCRVCTAMSAKMWRVGEEENEWQGKQEGERDKCVLRWWERGRLYWCHERINQ